MIPRLGRRGARAAGFVVAVLLAALALPLVALAHAELESASPPDGAVLDSPPTEIVLTFTEALNVPKSHMELIGPDGKQVAAGVVDPDNEKSERNVPPELAPGAYEIRSTAVAAHDGALKREVLTFTITAPSPTPTEPPTPAPSASATPSPSPSASPSAVPSAAPSAAPSAGGDSTASTGDVLLPIIAALVVVLLLGAMLVRSRSRGGGGA
jgi:methionine-rich copper-binding protein CopC